MTCIVFSWHMKGNEFGKYLNGTGWDGMGRDEKERCGRAKRQGCEKKKIFLSSCLAEIPPFSWNQTGSNEQEARNWTGGLRSKSEPICYIVYGRW